MPSGPPVGRTPEPRRWPWLVVVLLVGALVGGSVVAFQQREEATAQLEPEHPEEWDPRVAELAEYVEEARGLTFDHPVFVDFLTSEEYSEETRTEEDELTEEDREDLDESVSWLRAFGLAEGDIDLFEAFNDLSDTGTLAFYDPGTQRVTVRGTEMTVDVEVTLVHELTHALQDQHFDLDLGPEGGEDEDDDEDDEEDVTYDTGPDEAYRALVEGDAVRVENTYIDEELTSEEADDYYGANAEDVEDAEGGLAEVPAAMQAFQAEPYVLGNPFVELLFEDGSNEAVDGAFGDPPSTTEHLYDPRSYLEGDDPTELDYPDLPEGVDEDDLLSRSDLGATSVFLVLADRIDPYLALDAADGWGNARYSHYETDDRTCLRMAIDGDTDDDDQQLRDAFDLWVTAAAPEAEASLTDQGDGRSLLETCDPGPDAEATNDRALDNLILPVTRVQIALDQVAFANEDVDDAWAVGDCFVRQLTMEQLTATDYLDPEIQDAVDTAFETCAG